MQKPTIPAGSSKLSVPRSKLKQILSQWTFDCLLFASHLLSSQSTMFQSEAQFAPVLWMPHLRLLRRTQMSRKCTAGLRNNSLLWCRTALRTPCPQDFCSLKKSSPLISCLECYETLTARMSLLKMPTRF